MLLILFIYLCFLHSISAAKICGDPGTPANGYKEGLLYHFKSKVTFHCDKCYTLVGAANRVCNADQSWSDETPTCQSKQLIWLRVLINRVSIFV